MATLIPAIGACTFDTTGERRLAERLEHKLDDDYLLWYNVPMGPRNAHPDFCVMHPRRGLLVPPKARDVISIGHWGTGNLEVPITSQADLDAVKPFINAAYGGKG